MMSDEKDEDTREDNSSVAVLKRVTWCLRRADVTHLFLCKSKRQNRQGREKNAKNVTPRIDNDDESGHMSHICFFEPEISWWEI